MIEKYKVSDFAQMFPKKFESLVKNAPMPLWMKIDLVTDPNYYIAVSGNKVEFGYITDDWALDKGD